MLQSLFAGHKKDAQHAHAQSLFKTATYHAKRQSRLIGPQQARLYAEASFLTEAEVHRIALLVEALDTTRANDDDEDGTVDQMELMKLPEFVYNPFVDRIMRIFDEDGSGGLTLNEILDIYSVFSPRASVQVKAQALFNMFDYDEDGELSQSDVGQVLKKMMIVPFDSLLMGIAGEPMTSRIAEINHGMSSEEAFAKLEHHIKSWAEKIVEELDTTSTGTISYDEWEDAMSGNLKVKENLSFTVGGEQDIKRSAEKLAKFQKRRHGLNVESRFGGAANIAAKIIDSIHNPAARAANEPSYDGLQVCKGAQEGTTLHVRGIGAGDGKYESEQALEEIFAEFGEFRQATIRHRVEEGRNTSWALVTMATTASADRALEAAASGAVMAGDSPLVVTMYSSQMSEESTGHMKRTLSRDSHADAVKAVEVTCNHVPLFRSIQVAEETEDIDSPTGKGGKFVDLLADKLVKITATPGQMLVRKGDQGKYMFVVVQGEVGIYQTEDAEEAMVVVGVNEVFGARGIITGSAVGAFYKIQNENATFFRLEDRDLGDALLASPIATQIFNAGPEVRLATIIRNTRRVYDTPVFQAKRPPSLVERVGWLREQEQSLEKREALKELKEANQQIQTKGLLGHTVVGTPLRAVAHTLHIADDTVEHALSPLWQTEIASVQSKYGSGVSVAFQLQRWIGMQNLKVFLVWLVLVIVPRQLSIYWNLKLEAGAVGWMVPDVETASKYRNAALGLNVDAASAVGSNSSLGIGADGAKNRVLDMHMHSAYAPALGSDLYMQHFSVIYGACVIIIYAVTIRALLSKLRAVTAGDEVLGSGTESVAGVVSKADGYFGAMTMYDFAIRDPLTVATMQDGIFTHLEMLAENELKEEKAKNKSRRDSLLIWVGWLLYLVLIILMGTLIGLIMAEYWIKEECYFCNELDFSCATCSMGTENPLNSANKMLRPLLLSLTTAVIPFLIQKISLVEQRHDIGDQMKMFNIALMFLDLNKVAEADKKFASGGEATCLEDNVGDLFRSMILTDALVYLVNTILTWAIYVKIISNGARMEYDSDTAAEEAINIMYRQVVTWIATVTSPLMPILTFCISNCLMAVEFWALNNVYRPPQHPWSSVKTVSSFMALTFLSMLVSMVPAIVWMTNVRSCGPFQGMRPIDTPTVFLSNLFQEMSCHDLKAGQSCGSLSREPCMKRVALGDCEWRPEIDGSVSAAVLDYMKLGFEISSSPVFLLAAIGVTTLVNYFLMARIERWKHEVGTLQENSQAEQKFLVKKLRDMHAELAGFKGVADEDHGKYVKDNLKDVLNTMYETSRGSPSIETSAEGYHARYLATKGVTVKQQNILRKVRTTGAQAIRESNVAPSFQVEVSNTPKS